jgi:YfiH family protein
MSWIRDAASPLPLWRSNRPPGATLAFTTRVGGVSPAPFDTLNLGRSTSDAAEHVAENRRRVLHTLGLTPERLATAGQVHGRDVRRVTAPGHHNDCDALVTREPGLALAVTTADCMPILYAVPDAVAAAHSGWRGTADGMPVAALQALLALSRATVRDVSVHVGPCIRSCCYLVGSEVAERFAPADVVADGDRFRLDLPGAAARALTAAGVPPEAIHDTGACTACEPAWYYSHRRDAGATGRHWGIAALVAGAG